MKHGANFSEPELWSLIASDSTGEWARRHPDVSEEIARWADRERFAGIIRKVSHAEWQIMSEQMRRERETKSGAA